VRFGYRSVIRQEGERNEVDRRSKAIAPLGVAALIVAVGLFLALRPEGGDDAPADAATDAAAAPAFEDSALRVSPSSVLLTAPGETRRLEATLPGGAAASGVAWRSSDPAVVSVADDGTVEAHAGTGSVLVTASSGDRQSPPVLVYVAQPIDGAILVTDDQVEGNPVDVVSPSGGAYQYLVRLRGVDAPQAGAIVIGTGEAPVGGRVVDAQDAGQVVEVTLEVVPPEEMFARIEIDETIDLAFAEVEIPQELLDAYDVTRTADGAYEFTPKPASTQAFGVSGTQPISQIGPDLIVGPFTCEVRTALPVTLSQPVSFTINPSFSVDLVYRDRLERFVIAGGSTLGVKLSLVANLELSGKLECKFEAFEYRVPIGGALAYLFGVAVPVGVGFELEGKATFERFGYEVAAEIGHQFAIGVDCPGGASCSMVNEFDLIADGSVTHVVPDSETQFRVEPSLFIFLFAEGRFSSAVVKQIQFGVLELKGGLAQEANLASVSAQIADGAYASTYELKLKGEAEAGRDLDSWLGFFKLRTLKVKAEIDHVLYRSPIGSASADIDEFAAGDPVTFEIALDPEHLYYPCAVCGDAGAYNVGEVRIYRRAGDEPEQIAAINPEPGLDSTRLLWIADREGSIGNDFYAFVVTNRLTVPPLELGAVVPGEDTVLGTPTPTATSAPTGELCRTVWDGQGWVVPSSQFTVHTERTDPPAARTSVLVTAIRVGQAWEWSLTQTQPNGQVRTSEGIALTGSTGVPGVSTFLFSATGGPNQELRDEPTRRALLGPNGEDFGYTEVSGCVSWITDPSLRP
jgi:hypothetical protein